MYVSPHFVRSLHFVGIGGIGMSGIAEVLYNQGYSVRGSDLVENANVQRLRAIGIPVTIGHAEENIRGAEALVISSAVPSMNPEVVAARHEGIPVITRGEMLAEVIRLKKSIAISGSHGKTTTTSLIASVLSAADLDPTVINGGIINTYQGNVKLGNGEWMVVEADESDGSFLKLPSVINIITNIDIEHMNYYQTIDNLKASFVQFIHNLPFYGLGVMCTDDARIQEILQRPIDRRIVTYGFKGSPNFKGENVRFLPKGVMFDVLMTKGIPSILRNHTADTARPQEIRDIFIPMLGEHNVLNALAAIAVANELGIGIELVKQAFAAFGGVKRRFTLVGTAQGVTFIDDYAHHPSEINAAMKAAQQTAANRRIVLFQPHRFTRLESLWDGFLHAFNGADTVIVLPVYAAGESPIVGVDHQHFAEALKNNGQANVLTVDDYDALQQCVATIMQDGDMVIGLGAGSISSLMYKLQEALAEPC